MANSPNNCRISDNKTTKQHKMKSEAMMILAIANHKGGVGKTTTAITLAHLLQLQGRPVALVDLDAPSDSKPAGAAASYRRAGALGIPAYLIDEIPSELPTNVIIDCPPDAARDELQNALEISDLTLVPTSMSFDDLEVTMAFVEHFLTNRPYSLLFTRVLSQSRRSCEALRADLRSDGYKCLDHFTTALDVYAQAPVRGTTVAGMNTIAGRRAAREYRTILDEILRTGQSLTKPEPAQ